MTKRILIFGAGGHAKVLLDLIALVPEWEAVGVLDDDPEKAETEVLGVPVVGVIADAAGVRRELGAEGAAFGIGDNRIRAKWFSLAETAGLSPATLVHPSAVVSPSAVLSPGAAVLAGAVVNAGSVIVHNACLNTGASIDHDCKIGRHAHILPGATLTGAVEVGAYAVVGAGAVVNPSVKIGRNAYVGAGSVVLSDVGDNEVVVGNPAKHLKMAEPPDRRAERRASGQ